MNADSPDQNRIDSVHASVRQLLKLGLAASDSAEPQTITRTAKLKTHTLACPQLVAPLNLHFDAFDRFRRKVLAELESWWEKDPDAFTRMVKCNTREKYEEKSSCYAWLYKHFLTGTALPPELSRDAARDGGKLIAQVYGHLTNEYEQKQANKLKTCEPLITLTPRQRPR